MRDRTVYPLTGKVVLLTGAGGGLGSSLAELLVERGARVALVDIDGSATERVASTLPAGRSLPLVADVTDIGSVRAAAARTLEVFGRLDVAIANAGILGRAATFRTLSPDDVGRVLAVNVTGAVNTAAAATESVIANRGQIVVVSSVYAFMNGAGAIPYAMSKAAVAQLGRGLAIELAPHGASAMTAYFSLLDTGMIRHGIDDHPDALAVLETSPSFLLKRIQPRVAAAAIVHGLEIRAQRVLLPRRWRPLASLQGIVGPAIERKNARDAKIHAALMKLERCETVQQELPLPAHDPVSQPSAKAIQWT